MHHDHHLGFGSTVCQAVTYWALVGQGSLHLHNLETDMTYGLLNRPGRLGAKIILSVEID